MKKTLLFLFLLISTSIFSQFQTSYTPLQVCDDNNDGYATFNLSSKLPEILANVNAADYQVTFHISSTNATAGVNPIINTTSYTNSSPNLQQIFVRVVNINTNEVTITTFNLFVNPRPIVNPLTVSSCFNNGVAYFDLGSIAEQIWGQNNSTPNSLNVSFHLTQADAEAQANPLPYVFGTQNSVTDLFVNATYMNTSCSTVSVIVLIAETCGSTNCVPPTSIVTSNITTTSATVGWVGNGTSTTFEYIVLPQGSAAPTASATGFITTTVNPVAVTNLTPGACYTIYVRTRCTTTEASVWSTGVNFCTQSAPPVCGGQFIDNGGPNGNYLNNSDVTTTICPSNSGDVVTVTFTSFDTEVSWDALYVFNGNSIAAQQIASTNATGNVPGGLAGGFWGTTIPGPFTSTSPDGCLTFRFRSDGSVNRPGWVANITCAPAPTCLSVTQLTATNISSNSTTLGWNSPTANNSSNFEVLLLPQGSPVPTATTTGFITTTSNPYVASGLQPTTCYTAYVRVRCDVDDASAWSTGVNFCTLVAPPICGGQFVDNGGTAGNYLNNTNETTIICPTNPGQVVTVTFTEFDTEVNWDALYVYDGNSTAATQIASTNGPANVPGGIAGGYWGTTIPGPFTSTSADGCLTFVFRSDGSVTLPGWVANVTCESLDRIILNAFIDSNNNGVKDSGEVDFNHGSFLYDTNDSGNNTEVFSPNGYYVLTDPNGGSSFDIGYQVDSEYAAYFSAGTTAYNDMTIPVASGTQYLYFPITVTQTYTDVAVTIIPINAPRAGITNYRNEVIVKNLGIETISSTTLTFTKDSNLTIVNLSDSGATITPTGFSRTFTNLLPNESRSIIVNMSVPPIPTVSIGQMLTNQASVSAQANDLIAENNFSELKQPIVAAYDPNDKMESHGGRIQFDSFNQEDFLFYTIRFENTGNINAIDVKVTDELDSRIDETSVRMIAASHDYILTRTGSNLVWDFIDINLPVSITNTQIGKGYITFKVKLKPGFAIGDIIPNAANIFFDTNPPIVTNTFNTEFVQSLSTTTFTDNNIAVYPNPASTLVNVSLNNSSETISSVAVYDLLGKKVIENHTNNSNQVTINTSSLSKGVYLIEITSNSNIKLIKKLIIQ